MAEIVNTGKKRGRNGWKESQRKGGHSDQCSKSTSQEENPSLTDNGKKKRGRTCLQVMATGENQRKLVEWNERGQPVGEVSKRFSSTIGVIVREQVPINIETWHKVTDGAKNNLWKLLMQKYIVDICYKPLTLQQMGKLWRSWKSDLSVDIRKILESKSTKIERTHLFAKLKPNDVNLEEWDQFVRERMSDKWQEKSEKMRTIRSKQTLTHTMSRKGYARLENEYNKQNPDRPLTRPELWIKGHEQKKSKNDIVAAKIVEIQAKIDENPPSEEPVPIKDDILTHVLGKERPGRVRGLGAGVTPSKVDVQPQSDTKYQKLEAALKVVNERTKMLEDLIASKLGINLNSNGDFDVSADHAAEISKNKVHDNTSANRAVEREAAGTPKSGQDSTKPSINDKCKLLNWDGSNEVVARGSISAIDPKSTVHGYTLGPDCYRISIEDVFVPRAEFYRTEPEFANLDDARGSTIAWPIKYTVFDEGT